MGKKIDNKSLIHFELKKLEDKVKEFQLYLEKNTIIKPLSKEQIEDEQDKLHKEIVIQIKMQDALFSWMPALLKLREAENEKNKIDTRGDVEINGLFRNKIS